MRGRAGAGGRSVAFSPQQRTDGTALLTVRAWFCRSSGRAVRRQRASSSPRGAMADRVAGPTRAGEAACVAACVRACVSACVRACVRALRFT